ncbi:MAG TPA: hypothetical protein VGK67_33780 [Myxococcales bacterium]
MFSAAIIAWLALASTADLSPALVVRAPEPGAGARLASALSERMPEVRVVSDGQQAGAEDLVVALKPAEAHWDLVVERHGERALERSMPTGASGPEPAFFVSCAAVVERYLQDIDWKGRPESIDPGAVAAPRPAPVLVPLPRPGSAPADWSVGLAASGAAGIQKPSWRLGPAVDVSARRSGLLGSLRAQVYVPDSRTLTVTRPGRTPQDGQIQDLSASAALMGGACRGEDLSLCGGLQLGWRGTWVWGGAAAGQSDALFHWQLAHSDAFLAGLFARLSVRLPARLELRALLTASAFVGEDGFAVEGAGVPPELMPTRYEVGLALGLARRVP